MNTLTGLDNSIKKHILEVTRSTNAKIKYETNVRGTKLTIVIGTGKPYVADVGYILNRFGPAEAKAFILALVVLTSRQGNNDKLTFDKRPYREYAERHFSLINKHIRQIESRQYDNEDPYSRNSRTNFNSVYVAISGIATVALLAAVGFQLT